MIQLLKHSFKISVAFWISYPLAGESLLTLQEIPPEIKTIIIGYLPNNHDLSNVRSVCSEFNDIVSSNYRICTDLDGKKQWLAKKNGERFQKLTSFIQSETTDSKKIAEAYFFLGEMCLEGLRNQPDYKKAYGYFLKSVEVSPSLCAPIARIIWMHRHHLIEGPCPYDQDIQDITSDGNILVEVGYMYDSNNCPKAVPFYQKAADQGHEIAQYNLGILYRYGRGVSQDIQKAIKFYQKAADQNHAGAQFALGILHATGQGFPQDYTKAANFFQKAADQGDPGAQFGLGFLYDLGEGVQPNKKRAIELYQEAADQNHAKAQHSLGCRYFLGQDVPQDYQKAVEFLQKAADQNYMAACNNLGAMYALGQGVPQDYQKSIEFYQKAIDHGDEGAPLAIVQNNLGYAYERGLGVTKDETQAVVYYERASKGGRHYGTLNLAYCLENGIGVTCDIERARQLYASVPEEIRMEWRKERGLE